MRMAERDIVAKIRNYLKTVPHCFFWKEHGGKYGTAGIPDIIACIEGHFFGFEVKTDKGKPTVLQEATIRKILRCGGTAAVVRSVDEVRALIEGTLQSKKETGSGKPLPVFVVLWSVRPEARHAPACSSVRMASATRMPSTPAETMPPA